MLRSLPSPEIDPCPAHDIFYITQKFGRFRLRWIQKKKGIFEPRIVNGEVKWIAPEDPEDLRAQRDTLEVLGRAIEKERTAL